MDILSLAPAPRPHPRAKGMMMRCAAGCGQVVKSQGNLQALQRECVERGGFVRIGDLYYCGRCAKKRQK